MGYEIQQTDSEGGILNDNNSGLVAILLLLYRAYEACIAHSPRSLNSIAEFG